MTAQDDNFRLQDRLIEIETKLAYQEDLVQSLNDIIVQQGELIDRLELRLKKLLEVANNGGDDAQLTENAADELPPHY